ncbi:MAG: adenylyl-sulfate kinase [Ruminococcus sp.]|nr:adenylyl-sulfate kinase [Ruminococcus sp.]
MSIDITEINYGINSDPSGFIHQADSHYHTRLREIACDIAENRTKRPVILLSGPSGSGKTTTALMIEKILDDMGIQTHTLSMDNYFCSLTKEEKALMSEGKIDLESPLRVDSEFLSAQLEDIYNCRPVELPRYDFETSSRVFTGTVFERKQGELVILEGIHALNPDVITLPDEETAKIYVSVRTRITSGELTLHPSKIRLMRRLVRDLKFRKRALRETINMFASVEEGENKYIMPYKYRSTYDVDTFMPYEVCAYRQALFSDLSAITDEDVICDAMTVLSSTSPLSFDLIPPESLICEFIGNGQFTY